MEFKVGEVVVYPHHGAAEITAIEQREMGGETLEFLVLQIKHSDLVVRVPSKNAENVGVRDGVGNEAVFSINRPHTGLYLPRMVWKDMYDFSPDSVLLVLSSEPYDAEEYIRDYDAFVREVNGRA